MEQKLAQAILVAAAFYVCTECAIAIIKNI